MIQPSGYQQTDLDEHVKRIFDATPVAMILSRRDGSFEYVNPALMKMLGYDEQEIYNHELIISHPGDLAVNRQIRKQLNENPFKPLTLEKRYLHKDGHAVPGLLTIVAQPDGRGGVRRFIAQIIDLSDHKQTEESLWLMTTLLDHSSDAVMLVDPPSAQILDGNQLAWRRLGYSREEFLQLKAWEVNRELSGSKTWAGFVDKVQANGYLLREGWHTRKDGRTFPIEGSISYISQGEKNYLLAVVRDITRRKKNEELIWKQANFDPLTDLPNRRLLRDRLDQEIRKAHRHKQQVAVLYLDLDRFKEVNDSLGHARGDQLLVEAARRLQSCIRESDTLARQGGDEFTIVLGELEGRSSAERVAGKILTAIRQPFQLGADQVWVSTSIGIAFYPDDGTSSDVLFKGADQAMYAAKDKGRNGFQYFTPSMQQQALARVQLTRDLRLAITDQQFQLAYQPIVSLSSGSISKAEALLRWRHPVRGLISPNDFIPLAEETGLISEIGDWVFHQAVAQTASWRSRFGSDFQISINTSPVQYLNRNDTMTGWIDHLASLKLPGQAIAMEITEGVLMDSHPEVSEKLLAFQAAGVDVSLDDFGTGYSSLAYLKKFDIDFVKIDRSFVQNLTTDSDDRVLCDAIIAMAHKLGIRVIAEGIESEEQRALLAAAGCDYGQGFLFSKPLGAEAFEALLSVNSKNGC